jgi:hypothetical protein
MDHYNIILRPESTIVNASSGRSFERSEGSSSFLEDVGLFGDTGDDTGESGGREAF